MGFSICLMVRQVFGGYPMDYKINKMLLVLIPNVDCLESITQFRPVSFCTVLYNVITKSIVNWMRSLMSKLI